MIMDKASGAAASSMIPRQLLRSRRSPFFGGIFKRIRANSYKSAGVVSDVAGAAVASSLPPGFTDTYPATRSDSGKI